MKKWQVFCLSAFVCVSAVTLFIQANSLAEKFVDWSIDRGYQKEAQELYDTLYKMLEAQDAVEAIDSYLELTLPPIRDKYYETRPAEAKRTNRISQLQTAIQIISVVSFLAGTGGTIWSMRKQRNQ